MIAVRCPGHTIQFWVTGIVSIYGRAHLDLSYKVVPVDGQLHLVCVIQNAPIKNRFLKAIGVWRETAEDVSVEYNINDVKGNPIVHDVLARIRHVFDGGFEGKVASKLHTRIPSSVAYTDFALAYYDSTINQVIVVGDEVTEYMILPIGKYHATIKIQMVEQTINETKDFVVDITGFGWCG